MEHWLEVAQAARVLVTGSRCNKLHFVLHGLKSPPWRGRHRPHSRRARYPERFAPQVYDASPPHLRFVNCRFALVRLAVHLDGWDLSQARTRSALQSRTRLPRAPNSASEITLPRRPAVFARNRTASRQSNRHYRRTNSRSFLAIGRQ